MADSTLIALKQDISTAFTHLRSIEERARSLAEIDLEQRLLAFELLGEGLAIAVLKHLPPAIQVELLQSMDATALMRVLEEMEPPRPTATPCQLAEGGDRWLNCQINRSLSSNRIRSIQFFPLTARFIRRTYSRQF
ncbi:magnesium transporter MgtE N-terminal domain-containing protein [Thermoleptolyngbya sp.]